MNLITNDSRGVSPVIGVILMVAVTVIIAAVIGSTTLRYADDTTEPPAQAVLELDFEEEDTDASDELLWQLELSHTGGDNIDGEDIIVYLDHGDVRLTGEYHGTLSSGDAAEVAVVHTDGYKHEDEYDCDDDNVACSLATFEENYPNEDHVDLTMIHEPSDTILYEEEIDIGGDYGIYNDEEERSDDELTFK